MISFCLHFLLASLLLSLPLNAADQTVQTAGALELEKNVGLGELVTRNWLDMLDKGKYEESWDTGSLMFRNTIKKKEWKRAMNQMRKPLGSALSRSILDIRTAKDPKGLPAGDYLVFFYKTAFANKKEAHELITLVQEKDGQWKVLTYEVN